MFPDSAECEEFGTQSCYDHARSILLQKKYTSVVDRFSQKAGLPLADAHSSFYHSNLYALLHEGSSDIHCRSDEYLEEELWLEYSEQRQGREAHK